MLRSEVVRAEGDSVAQSVVWRALSDSIAAPPGEHALLVWNNDLAAVAAAHSVDLDRWWVLTDGEAKSGSNARPSIQRSSTAAIRSIECCLGLGMRRENRTPRASRSR